MAEIVVGDCRLSLPIWTVVDAAVFDAKGFPDAMRLAGSPARQMVFALFPSKTAAAVWAGAVEKEAGQLRPFEVGSASLLGRLAGQCHDLPMVDYAAIEPNPGRDVPARQYVRLDELALACRAADAG